MQCYEWFLNSEILFKKEMIDYKGEFECWSITKEKQDKQIDAK